jgi:superfamily II DNA or RNA helicase
MHCGKIRYRVDAKSQAAARPFEHFIIPRFTGFRKPAHQDDKKWTIADIYRDIQNSEIRNSLIVQDVVSAVKQGRNPIILTERTDHVNDLADRLKPHIGNVFSMTGGSGQKKSREILQAVADIPADEPFVLIATGKYVGEGFDYPRLDTLFLAMPISWKGTVQQYAGRLHRLFDGKNEVQIYDYVDIHVAMLEKMYQRRLKGYAAIGYKAKGAPQPIEDVHSIFDNNNFFPVYSADVLAARSEVIIVSPFLTRRRIMSSLNYLTAAGARVTVVTKPPDNYSGKDRDRINECIELLVQHGIAVKTKGRIHQKFAIIDQRFVWYGSINLLSYGASEESIMRIESMDIAAELSAMA